MLATPPTEVLSAHAWQQADPERQRLILLEICNLLGPDYGVTIAGSRELTYRMSARSLCVRTQTLPGLRITHQPTLTSYCLIPAGVFPATSHAYELSQLESADTLNHAAGEVAWRNGHYAALGELQLELAALNYSNLEVAPFLLAESPLSRPALYALNPELKAQEQHAPIPLIAPSDDPYGVAFAQWDAFAPFYTTPTTLIPQAPSELEWEYACRAGTHTPFYWSARPPDSIRIPTPALHLAYLQPPHPWGLSGLGAFPEATQTLLTEHLGVCRGGVLCEAQLGRPGWLWMLSSQRRFWQLRGRELQQGYAALRPVIRLPFARPQLPDRAVIPPRPELKPRLSQPLEATLQALCSPSADTRSDAYDKVRQLLGYPQGIVSQLRASLPLLRSILEQEWLPDRDLLLQLLDDLFFPVEYPLALGCERPLTLERALAERRALALELYPHFLHWVEDPEPTLRARATFIFSQLPELEHRFYPVLKRAIARESNPELLANQLLALSHLHRWARRRQPEDFKPYFASDSALLAGAARLGALSSTPYLLHYPQDSLQAAHSQALSAFCLSEIQDLRLFPWGYLSRVTLTSTWLSTHAKLGPQTALDWLHSFYLTLESQASPLLEEVYLSLLQTAFDATPPLLPEHFSDRHWKILSDLSRRDYPAATTLWERATLPTSMGERRRFILRHRGRF